MGQVEQTLSSQMNDSGPKTKHKHNILLGYDFVDEPDCEVQAWDLAINRKNKKVKKQLESLKETEIKQEPETVCEQLSVTSAQELKPSEKGKDVSDVIQKLNDLDQIDLNEDDTINSEVNNSMQTMLTQISLEERMRISLLSDVLKKHSPKKNILQKLPRAKSPRMGPEPLKKEKKRNSKDSLQKRLSMEENPTTGDNLQNTIDDITSELLSICKESNIDTPKHQQQEQIQQQEQVQHQEHVQHQEQVQQQQKYPQTPTEHYTLQTEQQETLVECPDNQTNEIQKESLSQSDEPVKGILTVEELIESAVVGQQQSPLQTKVGEVEQEDPEEHDLLTFYSTKSLTPEKTEKDNPDTKVPERKNIEFKPIIFVDETKIDQTSEDILEDQRTELNSPKGQNKDKDVDVDDRNVVISLNPQSVSQTSDMYAIRQETVEQPLHKKERGNEETCKFHQTDSIQSENKELEEFNSGIIPEVMTSDLKLDSKTNEGIAEKSSELSVSFELSGDESISIELSPTKDNERETSTKKLCKRIRKGRSTKDNNSKDEATPQEIIEAKKDDNNEANILQFSFEKADNKSNEKDLTDESSNTSGFDISSIINRLEDDDEDEMEKPFVPKKLMEESEKAGAPGTIDSIKKKKNKSEIKKIDKEISDVDKDVEDAEKTSKKSIKKETKKVDTSSENLLGLDSKDSLKNILSPKHTDKETEKINIDKNIDEIETGTKCVDTDKNSSKIENGFVYVDQKMPEGWYVIVRMRTDGKPDSYFFTPCHTKLRSKSEIIKFLDGSLPSKPVKKPMVISEIPLRENLSKEHLDLTRDIDPTIFEISKLKKTDDANNDGNNPANDKTENKEVPIKPDEKTKIITTKSNKKEKENEDKDKNKKEQQKKIKESEKPKKEEEKKKKEKKITEEKVNLKKKEIDEKVGEEECESKKGVDKLNKEQEKSIKEKANIQKEEDKLSTEKSKTKIQKNKLKKEDLKTKKEQEKEKSPNKKGKSDESKADQKDNTIKKDDDKGKKEDKTNKKDVEASSNTDKKKSPKKNKRKRLFFPKKKKNQRIRKTKERGGKEEEG